MCFSGFRAGSAQFGGTLGRRRARVAFNRLWRWSSGHQLGKAGRRGPAGRGHAGAKLGRRLTGGAHQRARPFDRGAGQPFRHVGGQPHLHPGAGQAFHEIEDIGGAGAGQRRGGVDQSLVGQPLQAPDRGQQGLGARLPIRRAARLGHRDGGAAPDRRRKVRHRPHHAARRREQAAQVGQRLARHDRQHQRVRRQSRLHARRGALHHLRLDRDHQGIDCGGIDRGAVRRFQTDAGPRGQFDQIRRGAGVGDRNGGGRHALRQPAAQHGAAHASGTQQKDRAAARRRSGAIRGHWGQYRRSRCLSPDPIRLFKTAASALFCFFHCGIRRLSRSSSCLHGCFCLNAAISTDRGGMERESDGT
ncbi:protein of unknown function (plasmid) [Azospirillum baldaniorum]|uniref:Uncharacterized protein n=1 Tax=Azospirillum baldaniorum TaxID=1064539 RepID=A0A9P1JXF4_9PROT|nr:protein of unknown function [Azospirillum baldaniorum]